MTRMQNGFQALYPKKPEPANQSQYRNVNSNSTGGVHPAYMAQSYKDFAAKSDPVLNRRSNNAAPRDPYNPLTARQPAAPFMVRPHGTTAGAIADLNKGFNRLRGSDPWADKVNRMDDTQLGQAVDPGASAWRSRQSPANVVSNPAWNSVPGGISVSQGSPYPVTPRGRVTSGGLDQLLGGPLPQSLTGMSALRRSDVPAWSLNGGVSPATERASQSFNQAAQAPPVSTGKIISDRITENMNNASIQGRQDANGIVDRNLNARMGYYSTPQARQSGFFQRGMGPMAGDAVVMQNQNRPLGDGGLAAYAARSDQERRRMAAGPQADGLTRYTPNQDVLDFANQGRQPMQAMTPAEIQFYRHKMSMASNPQYAQRVLQERMDRQGMLDNQRLMAGARRAGALEAAGASQQLRNLQAGRGALGGQAGFGALLGAAAQQDPNGALGNFGNALMAQNAPGMLRDRLASEENMLKTRAELGRQQQYENMRMQIVGSGMPEIEKQRALQSLNSSIMNSGYSGYGESAMSSQGGDAPVTSSSGSVNGIPNWLPLPDAFPDDTIPTVNRLADYRKSLAANPQWMQLPPDQQAQILSQIESQYFPGIRQSDRQQLTQDNALNPLSRLFNAGMSAIGMDAASQSRRQESLDALNPYRAGSAPYRAGQNKLTPEQVQAVEQMPDSRDRQMYERLLRQGIPQNKPRLGMWDAWSQLMGLGQ